MKKTLGVVAAAAMAAMPVMGAFAAITPDTEFTDTITVTLPDSCTFSADGNLPTSNPTINGISPAAVTVENGHLYNTGGTDSGAPQSTWTGTYHVYCNDNGKWFVTAEGASDVTKGNAANSMAPSTLDKEEAIATGTAKSGATANWAFMLSNAGSNSTIIEGYGAYTIVPTSATKVVEGTGTAVATGEGRFSTNYQVYIGTATKADTYTGAVTYKLGHPLSAYNPGA